MDLLSLKNLKSLKQIFKRLFYIEEIKKWTYGLLPVVSVLNKNNIIWGTEERSISERRKIFSNISMIDIPYNIIEIHINYNDVWGIKQYGKIIITEKEIVNSFITSMYILSIIYQKIKRVCVVLCII